MKRIVLLSGGLDSATCLALAKESGDEVCAVSVFYGQKHEREIRSAQGVAAYYGTELFTLDLAEIFKTSGSALLAHSKAGVPHGSYKDQMRETGIVATYVPFRNGLMIAAVASMGLGLGANEIWYGAHADDAAGGAYPDCTPEFLSAIDAAVKEGTAGAIRVVAPFINKTKAGIVAEGIRLGVPYELTWSCYEGGEKPCGKCGTCIDRAKAFQLNGLKDPLLR